MKQQTGSGFNFGSLCRALPPFKGKMRVAGLVTKTFLEPKQKRVVRLANGMVMELPNLVENLALEIFVNGTYESDLVNYLVKHLPLNSSFVDVGANIGAISLFVAKQRPDVNIYAFEASATMVSFLRRNMELNDIKNVRIEHKAVYVTDNMHLDFFSPVEKFGKGSLAPVFTQSKETVETIRLDSFLIKHAIFPSFIKIDVEGFEVYVIESLDAFFKENIRPIIIFEFVDWAERASTAEYVGAAQSKLMAAGYTIYDFDEYILDEKTPITDLVTSGSREFIGMPARTSVAPQPEKVIELIKNMAE